MQPLKLGRIQKKYVAVIVLVTALISSFITYSFAGSISNTLTLSAGIYPGVPTITVWTDGANYFAKDQNGVVDYSGSDAADVLQDALNVVTASGGDMYVKAGDYALTSNVTVEGAATDWKLEFEKGAMLTYSSTGAAIYVYAAVRGNINRFEIVNPQLTVTDGAYGIEIDGGYLFNILNPYIEVEDNGIGISIDHANTFKILNGGYIHGDGTAGSIGLRLGADSQLGDTCNDAEIAIHEIATFEYGITCGNDAETAADEAFFIHNCFIAACDVAVQIYSAIELRLQNCYFEVNNDADIVITNSGSATPSRLTFENNVHQTADAYAFDMGTASYSYYVQARNNNWGAGNIRLSNNIYYSTFDYGGCTGTVTQTSSTDWSTYVYSAANRGIAAVGAGTDNVQVTLPQHTNAATYTILAIPLWETDVYVYEKQDLNFTLYFGNVAPGGGSYVQWVQLGGF